MNTSATYVVVRRRYREAMATTPSQSVAKLQWVVYGQHQQLNSMAVDSIQQEDKMVIRQQYTPEYPVQLQSWKEVVELYLADLAKDYPEDLWVDPAEVDYDSKEAQ
jgi:hypothetical protein